MLYIIYTALIINVLYFLLASIFMDPFRFAINVTTSLFLCFVSNSTYSERTKTHNGHLEGIESGSYDAASSAQTNSFSIIWLRRILAAGRPSQIYCLEHQTMSQTIDWFRSGMSSEWFMLACGKCLFALFLAEDKVLVFGKAVLFASSGKKIIQLYRVNILSPTILLLRN